MPLPAPGLLALLLPALLLANLPAAASADTGADAEALRCFELRDANPAGAVKVAEAALAAPGIGEESRIKLLACLGRSAALAGDAVKAEAAVSRMAALLAARQVPPEFALRALSNAGATLHTLGRIGPALEYYARAYEAARQSESDLAQVAMLSNVASIHSEALEAYDEAEAYYARAAAVQQRAGEADALLPYNRGSNYRRMGRVDDALAALAAAERAAGDTGQEVLLQRARAERLVLETLQAPGTGDADAAHRQLLEIAQRQRALEDTTGAAGTLLRLSDLALRRGDPADALAQAQRAGELLPKTGVLAEHREALAAQLAALTALERWREALDASEALRALEGAHARGVELGALASLQAKLEDTHSGEELQRLQEERRVEALQMAHAARLRNGALVGVGALIVLGAAFVWYQRGVTARLRRLSTIDGLTGLLNRRAASRQLELEGPGPARGARRNVVFLIDIDHFKSRNDRHGHAAGDAVLKAVARELRACSRPGDVVARWGGEEFLVGCRALDLAGACAVAQRLREAAASAGPGGAGEGDTLSVSIGFASHPFCPQSPTAPDWQDALSVADRALYAAKHGGRDAWVGVWGHDDCRVPVADLLADPAAHAGRGHIEVVSSRQPVEWQPRA